MKILIVRFSSIGDIVLTSPVIRGINEQLENAEIHYLTKKPFASIVETNPRVARTFAIEKSIEEILPVLKAENYDHIVDLHNNIRTRSLTTKLRRPFSRVDKLNIKKWLLVKLKINKMPKVHVVQRYFEAVKTIGVKADDQPGEFYISSQVAVNEKYNLEPKGYISLAIGAQYKTKRMPNELVIDIIKSINVPVVLIGGKADMENADYIAKQVGGQVINLCGELSLEESASVVQQSKRLVSNDTGMMHIGACLNVPISSVWGNTVPDLGMYPYYPKQEEKFTIHEVDNLNCRPCSKIGYNDCPKGHFKCMLNQDVNAITENLK